jgi:hypothetical protein
MVGPRALTSREFYPDPPEADPGEQPAKCSADAERDDTGPNASLAKANRKETTMSTDDQARLQLRRQTLRLLTPTDLRVVAAASGGSQVRPSRGPSKYTALAG